MYTLSILPCLPHIFNDSIINKYIGNTSANQGTHTKDKVIIHIGKYQSELIKNDSIHWMNQSVFNE